MRRKRRATNIMATLVKQSLKPKSIFRIVQFIRQHQETTCARGASHFQLNTYHEFKFVINYNIIYKRRD